METTTGAAVGGGGILHVVCAHVCLSVCVESCDCPRVRAWARALVDVCARVFGAGVRVQIGLGPAGELRYPSFPLSRWCYPGPGAFQVRVQLSLSLSHRRLRRRHHHCRTSDGNFGKLPSM
jgi:hypothetical protein